MLCQQESLLYNGLREHQIVLDYYFLWIAILKIIEHKEKQQKLYLSEI